MDSDSVQPSGNLSTNQAHYQLWPLPGLNSSLWTTPLMEVFRLWGLTRGLICIISSEARSFVAFPSTCWYWCGKGALWCIECMIQVWTVWCHTWIQWSTRLGGYREGMVTFHYYICSTSRYFCHDALLPVADMMYCWACLVCYFIPHMLIHIHISSPFSCKVIQ